MNMLNLIIIEVKQKYDKCFTNRIQRHTKRMLWWYREAGSVEK